MARRQRVHVNDLFMAVTDSGVGRRIVMLHGNPTSSWLWRKMIEPLAALGRVIAPDLIGMGESDPVPSSGPASYRFVQHRQYLDDLLIELGADTDVIIVGHDWGAVLGFDWARRHERSVAGIAYMETTVTPRRWSDESPTGQHLFRDLRSPAGERMVLDDNIFIETVLATSTNMTSHDLDVYRSPYVQPGESRRPMLTWARQIPFDGEPSDVHDIVTANAEWLSSTTVPKLFIAADPGAITVGPMRTFCETFPNQRMVEVAAGHFVPEDNPTAVTAALVDWITSLEYVDPG